MATYQMVGGVPDFYTQMLNDAQQQLVRLPDGSYVVAPQYGQSTSLEDIYGGVLPSSLSDAVGVAPIGVQGTKRNRGSMPSADNSLGEPWPGAYDQTMYRNGSTRRDVIQNIPAPDVQTASGYSGLDTIDTLNPIDVNNWGLTRQSFFAKPPVPAERAIVEATIRGGSMPPSGGSRRGRPTRRSLFDIIAPPNITTEDPWANLRLDPDPQPRRGMVTATPQGKAQPKEQKRSFSLFDALVSMSEGGGRATGPQLATMQAAAPSAQDPALAAALNAGRKGYVPTNPNDTGVLGAGALMPTVAMNGNPIRNR